MSNIVNVAWMYPDILNLHGERGNAKAFELVSKKMGVKLNIDRIDDIDSNINYENYDILLFNAGELKHIEKVKERLENDIDKIKENNKIIFVTGTTGALFAHNIDRLDGSSFNGLNLLDMDVKERSMVLGDDLYYKFEKMEIMSSQIQMIDITLNKAKEFGKIIYGYGNNGKNEGARNKNLLFTNALGPVLVKNPWLTEYLINLALKNKGLKEINKKIDFDLELKSLESAKEFINKKIESEKNTKK